MRRIRPHQAGAALGGVWGPEHAQSDSDRRDRSLSNLPVGRRSDHLLLVAEGTTAADAQQAIREANPQLLLVNMSVLQCFDAKQEIAASHCNCKIAVLTERDDALSVSRALAMGAAGYILKAITGVELRSIAATRT